MLTMEQDLPVCSGFQGALAVQDACLVAVLACSNESLMCKIQAAG